MKSLSKALDVLEFVICREGEAVTPSDAAVACGINTSSCVRMIKLLVDRGYLEQVSRRSGYVAGPAAVSLGDRKSVYGRLAEAATAPLTVLAEQIGGLVNLSVCHQGRRYIVKHLGRETKVRLAPAIRYNDNFYDSATGRLLMATMSRDDVARLVGRIGLPSGIGDLAGLERELALYRQRGWVKFWSDIQQLWVVGSLVEVSGFPSAAIGFGVIGEAEADDAVGWSGTAAAGIEANLAGVRLGSY